MLKSITPQYPTTHEEMDDLDKSQSKADVKKLRQKIQAIFYNNPDQYPPIINGARFLSQAGFSLELLCRDNGERWNVNYPAETEIKRIDTMGGSSWQEYFGFIKKVWSLADPHASAFVGHDAHGLLAAWLLAKRYRRPLIYHCHDYIDSSFPLHTMGSRIVYHFQKLFARNADLITIPDAGLGEVMMRELRLKRKPLTVANAPLKCTTYTGARLRAEIAARNRRFEKIVFRQGRVGEGHAIESTLRSIPHWTNKSWGFVLMGISDAPYLDKLSRLAQSLGVEAQFLILPPVGYDEVMEFTPGADLGHALYEPTSINNIHITGSNKIQEYMSAGLPLLVSDRPALRAMIEKYRCGLVADESVPESIARAVNLILSDETLARNMGAASIETFERELCFAQQFGPVVEEIQNLMASSNRS